MRPILPNGEFYAPFDPLQGLNFEPSPGFHEGNAWNYTFAVPHDVMGLAKLMGGKKNFVEKLQMVFDKGYFDMSNEPDIAYPYLFSYFKGEEWRTQKLVRELIAEHFTNKPAGLPGNDDTGTMSAWAAFSMMGFYPTCPGDMNYTLTSPVFEKVTIKLDPKYYGKDSIVITTNNPENVYIKEIKLNDKKHNSYFISHKELVNSANLFFELEKNHK
ncbi:MAG: GH92 family glycosyl hydrolase, partial [Marinifilaceae bacterium]